MTSTRYRLLRWIMAVAVLSAFAVAWVVTYPRNGRITFYSDRRSFLLVLGFVLALIIVRVLLAPEIRLLLDRVVRTIRLLGSGPVRVLRGLSLVTAALGLISAIVLSVLALHSSWLRQEWPIGLALFVGFAGLCCYGLTIVAARTVAQDTMTTDSENNATSWPFRDPRVAGVREHYERVKFFRALAETCSDAAGKFRLLLAGVYSARGVVELIFEAADKGQLNITREDLKAHLCAQIRRYDLIERIRIHDFHRLGLVPPDPRFKVMMQRGPVKLRA